MALLGKKKAMPLHNRGHIMVVKDPEMDVRTELMEQIVADCGGKLDHETSDKISILVADPRRYDETMLESMRKSCKGEAVVVTHEWLRLVSETRVWTDPIGSKYVMLPRPDGAAASTLTTSSSKRAREGGEQEGQKEKWARILSTPTATPVKGDGKSPTIGSGKKALSKSKSRGSFGGELEKLWTYVRDIEGNKADILEHDDKIVMINDKYPKAKKHILVLSRKEIEGPDSLKEEDFPLLQHMHKRALEIAKKLKAENRELEGFRIGYHAIPSMSCLHLHVISVDFESDCLKNGNHWTSFQPPFFIDSMDMQRMIKKKGAYTSPCDEDVKKKGDLVCHRCKENFARQFAQLKRHIKICEGKCSVGMVYCAD